MALSPATAESGGLAHCPRCKRAVDPRVLALATTLQPTLITLAQSRLSHWQPSDGLCPDCVLTLVSLHAAQRSPSSLHTTTDPPTTFPYYHPDEETVLSQTVRLPRHDSFDGSGVTVAFLDSGFYPHPDLAVSADWPDAPEWSRLSEGELRRVLSAHPLRLIHYVDLTDEQQAEGLAQPSLWDGAGNSWHGQMTTTTAVGNGLLSGGEYTGYAPSATVLPIKIGRRGGRIPEDDILRGLNWLLEEDRWAQYGVRVLNVSVGGDYPEPWHLNSVCLAAEELAQRGVFIAAAAGNSQQELLLAPAQAPAVLTVGGVDDGNRHWVPFGQDDTVDLPDVADATGLTLYPHNWGRVGAGHGLVRKPEALALGRWLPSPVLPPSPVFDEMVAIAHLRTRMRRGGPGLAALAQHWRDALHSDPIYRQRRAGETTNDWYGEIWRALRKRMNAHKWIHAYYQHVDGTSVSVAQVSAVAAQMIQANPALTPRRIKRLIVDTALSLDHLPRERSGAGVIQPRRAVAAALRTAQGLLTGLPPSATQPEILPDAPRFGSGDQMVYVGLWMPNARAVSVVGAFNGWQPDAWCLDQSRPGWWHGVLALSPGAHHYRFWATDIEGAAIWLPDPENPAQVESGYAAGHSLLVLSSDRPDRQDG